MLRLRGKTTIDDVVMLIEEDEEQQQISQETVRYLTHVEQKLYSDIQARKRIDSGLLFLACQISSCSLSWLLFQLQVTLSIIQVSSAVVSLLPGLIDVGDGFNFLLTSESWEFTLGNKPLVGIGEEGRRQRAEGRRVQYSLGFRPRLIASHQIFDFGGGLKPLLPLVAGRGQETEFPSAFCLLPSAFFC